MATVIIDGDPAVPPIAAETLGDLLAAIDARLAAERRLVTLLRIDGVEVPAFRDPAMAATPAAGIGRLELESAPPGVLAANCLREAGQALRELAAAADAAALDYRMEEVATGNRALVALTEGIGAALAVTGAASLGLGFDITRLATPHGAIFDVTADVSTSLDELIRAQGSGDWNGVARGLTDGLAPQLRRWGAACASIDPSQLA